MVLRQRLRTHGDPTRIAAAWIVSACLLIAARFIINTRDVADYIAFAAGRDANPLSSICRNMLCAATAGSGHVACAGTFALERPSE